MHDEHNKAENANIFVFELLMYLVHVISDPLGESVGTDHFVERRTGMFAHEWNHRLPSRVREKLNSKNNNLTQVAARHLYTHTHTSSSSNMTPSPHEIEIVEKVEK